MTQLPLINAPAPVRPSRPELQDADVIEEAINKTIALFMRYLGDDCLSTESEVRDDLKKLLDEFYVDGYEMARRLENQMHWETDRELLDLCDVLESNHSQAHSDFIKRWIEIFQIEPLIPIGTHVKITVKKHQYDGEIVRYYQSRGQYAVYIPALHKNGTTTARLIDWEVLEKANEL
jgi:hypothetical protein